MSARRTTARITAFNPGQSPPPVRIPMVPRESVDIPAPPLSYFSSSVFQFFDWFDWRTDKLTYCRTTELLSTRDKPDQRNATKEKFNSKPARRSIARVLCYALELSAPLFCS